MAALQRTLRLRLLLVPRDETFPWCNLSSGPASLCAGLLFCPRRRSVTTPLPASGAWENRV